METAKGIILATLMTLFTIFGITLMGIIMSIGAIITYVLGLLDRDTDGILEYAEMIFSHFKNM